VYDAKNGFSAMANLAGSPGYQSCLVFSPDGRQVVSGARNGPARMWRVETGQQVMVIHGHSSGVRDAVFSPDGSMLATVGSDRRVVVSDVLDYQDVSSLIDFSPWQLTAFAFTSDGRRLLSGSNQVRLWDLDRRAARFTARHGIVSSLAVHPNDEEFAAGHEDGKVVLLGKDGKTLESREMKGFPLALRYADGGQRVLVAGWDNAVYSWNPAQREQPQRILGPLGKVDRRGVWRTSCLAAFSAEGDLVAYAERGQAPAVWSLQTRQKLVALSNAPASVTAIAFDREGTRLALGGEKGELQIRDARTGELTTTFPGHPMDVAGLAFTPDGSRLASVAGDGVVKFWDPAAGAEVLSLRGHATYDSVLAFSPDGEDCVVGGWDGFVRLWSIRDPQSEPPPARRARRRAWHEWHAADGYTSKRWFVAVHHLGQLVALEPENWRPLRRRAWARASMQDWDGAAADLDRAMELPNCDIDAFSQRAELYLRAGESENYRKACERLRELFGERNDLHTANTLLWTCSLHPSAAALAKELAPKAEAALARASPKERKELLNTVGAVMYRAGRFDDAVKYLDDSAREQGRGGFLEDGLFLAMAHHRQQNKEKARGYLDRAGEEMKKLRAGTRPSDGRDIDWRLLLEVEGLYKEAQAVCK
jgi:WD40 repeat protein